MNNIVYIVLEVSNDYINGIYTSELNAIKGIFKDVRLGYESDSEMEADLIMDAPVNDCYKLHTVKLDINYPIGFRTGDAYELDEIKGRELIGEQTYSDLKLKLRELTINEIVD